MDATASDSLTPLDGRFSGFGYQNWDMDGEPPIMVNPKASLHHKLAWLWSEASCLTDLATEICCENNKELRTFANFILSRMMPMEAMLEHLGETTRKGAANV